jgi:osmotically-inducible protein OsmY
MSDMQALPAHDQYAEAAVHRLLAEDADIAEQGIEVIRHDGTLVLRGQVESAGRRDAIGAKVAEHFPDSQVRNDITISAMHSPSEAEELW